MTSINKARNSGGYYYAWRDGREEMHPLSGGACPTFRGALIDMIERERNADFRAVPILRDYIAAMLTDLDYTERDERREQDLRPRDSGTIYTLPDAAYQRCKADCEAFYSNNREAIDAATDLEPGEDGLRYANGRYMTHERIGYYLYMTRVGHGVTFTDDGDAPCLKQLSASARNHFHHFEGAYFGDDGKVYI